MNLRSGGFSCSSVSSETQVTSFPESTFKVGNMRLDRLAQSKVITKLKRINIYLFTWLLFNWGEQSSFIENQIKYERPPHEVDNFSVEIEEKLENS
ncbi:hypothetical protein STEG23_035296 [Scotinomys teguina]